MREIPATPTMATTATAVAQRAPVLRVSAAADYWALTKPEVNFLIVIATGAGFSLGCPTDLEAFPLMRLIHTLLGTLLIASGAAITLHDISNFPRPNTVKGLSSQAPLPLHPMNRLASQIAGTNPAVIPGMSFAAPESIRAEPLESR